nr:MAG TPA: hypothetical protein [Caudoviricetes sp.]
MREAFKFWRKRQRGWRRSVSSYIDKQELMFYNNAIATLVTCIIGGNHE